MVFHYISGDSNKIHVRVFGQGFRTTISLDTRVELMIAIDASGLLGRVAEGDDPVLGRREKI
jgi:hypothetical protein